MSEPPPQQPVKPATWYRYMDASSLGIEIAVSVVIGAAAGMWLEKNVTHWSPWTSVMGVMVGVGTATRAIVRTARKYTKQLREQDAYEAALADVASPALADGKGGGGPPQDPA